MWKMESLTLRDKLKVSPSFSPWTGRPGFKGLGVSKTQRVLDLMDVVTATVLSRDLARKPVEVTMEGVILDISQSHARRTLTSRFGVAPCLTTSSLLYSFDHDIVLAPQEHMFLQGHPKDISLPDDMGQRSVKWLRALAGEGMALPCLGLCIVALIITKPIPC